MAVSTDKAKADKAARTAQRVSQRASERAANVAKKASAKAAKKASGKSAAPVAKLGKADRLAAERAAAAASDQVSSRRLLPSWGKSDKDSGPGWDKPTYAPGEEPSKWDLSEWSLRRKIVLVLALPVIVAAAFGGLRVNTERQLADNYAASASQVGVLKPAVDYLAAAERAAVVARAVGINDPKLEEAQQDVVETGAKFVEARDKAELTPTQLRQVNDVISLSEQMRNGNAYVSLTSSVSQVRQLERGLTQVISTIIAEQTKPEPELLILAQALDGRLSLSLQEIQVANVKTIPANPVELYTEFGVELGAIDRLAVALGQTDPRVLEIRQSNAQRVVNARGGNTKISAESYASYDVLIDDLLTEIDDNLAASARNARVLTYVDSIIIGGALLAAIILALLVSRLILNPIRRVRAGALRVAHEKLPEAVARIRSGEEPGEIEPIGVTTHEETGQLARAVDDLHRQAVKLASGEAALREQVGDMFVTLSRRNTSLINQQLGLIENLESDEEDPQRLESLFRLDHLASRMRRNAESLVILSGAPTRATEQDDLSLTDVLQAAIAGVQDYRRVQLDAAPAQRVSGEAAADIVHLLAELVDNALSYSPPSSRVMVTSSFTRGGVVVQVTDAGLGIAEDALHEINERLRSGGEVTPETARRMGLFVTSRLAQRHGLTVELDGNDRMGITATVFLPTSVLSDTARLEAGSGGAQVIELGAATAAARSGYDERDAHDESSDEPSDGPAGDAEVVAYRRPEPTPEQVRQYDPITAAINAYGLPQRRPGASGAGRGDLTASMGGGFFERVDPENETPAEAAPVEVEVEPVVEPEVEPVVEPEVEPVVVDAVLVSEVEGELEAEAEQVVDAPEEEERAPIALGPVAQAAPETQDVDTDVDTDAETAIDHPDTEGDADGVEEATDPDVADEATEADDADDDLLAPVVATLPLRPSVPFEPPAAEHQNGNGKGSGHGPGNGPGNGLGNGLAARLHNLAAAAREGSDAAGGAPEVPAAPAAAWNAALTDGPTDGLAQGAAATRTPSSMDEDETPIFRSLRSNWLSSDTGEQPWADSEVDAGWDAADRVEATPPTRRTETGLPMRRPGNRLIPGGLSAPAPVQTVRDPEAIRARLAAHAAGVSRGRSAATVPNPSTQEADPA